MVTVILFAFSSGVTFTISCFCANAGAIRQLISIAAVIFFMNIRLVSKGLILERFTVSHYLLCIFVEGYFSTCMHGSICHYHGYSMCIAGFHRCMGLLAAAHAFHPVTDMVGGKYIATGIGRSYYFFCRSQAHLR